MTVNRTSITLTQGLQRPLRDPGVALARPGTGRNLALLVALLAILVMVAF
jgi:hypothetical protein